MMPRHLIICGLVLVIGCLAATPAMAGCCPAKQSAGKQGCGMPAVAAAAVDMKALCSKCGQVKGTELCCRAGAEKCPHCGLDMGSPGCCRLKTKE
ncbi:MAG: hypothetical protein V1789_03085 [PVC group bacterium]